MNKKNHPYTVVIKGETFHRVQNNLLYKAANMLFEAVKLGFCRYG